VTQSVSIQLPPSPPDPKATLAINRIAITNTVQIELLIDLLDEKTIIVREELTQKWKKVEARFEAGRCLFEPVFVSFRVRL